MGEQKDGLGLWVRTVQHGHQTALARMVGRGEDMQIMIRIARRLQPRRHPLGGKRAAARRQGGVGFHQFFIKGAERRLGRVGTKDRVGDGCAGEQSQPCDETGGQGKAHGQFP